MPTINKYQASVACIVNGPRGPVRYESNEFLSIPESDVKPCPECTNGKVKGKPCLKCKGTGRSYPPHHFVLISKKEMSDEAVKQEPAEWETKLALIEELKALVGQDSVNPDWDIDRLQAELREAKAKPQGKTIDDEEVTGDKDDGKGKAAQTKEKKGA